MSLSSLSSGCLRSSFYKLYLELWLSSLKSHLSVNNNLKITKDPLMLERRRLACATPIPKEILRFA